MRKEAIRLLYNKMFEPGGYRYENLDLQGEHPTLLTRHAGGGHSICKFGPDALTIEEKRSRITVDEFVEAVKTVLGGLDQNDVPSFFIQQCKMQCLAQPSNVENSLILLAARVANVYGPIDPFERPPSYFGVRFRFPPAVLLEEGKEPGDTTPEAGSTQEHEEKRVAGEVVEMSRQREAKGFIAVRFETYAEDVSQVWMEVSAAYPITDQALLLRDVEKITDNIRETHRFLAEKSKRFLDQFDTKDDDRNPEGKDH